MPKHPMQTGLKVQKAALTQILELQMHQGCHTIIEKGVLQRQILQCERGCSC